MRLIVIPDKADGRDHAEFAGLEQTLSAHPLNVLVAEASRRIFYATDDSAVLEECFDSRSAASIAWVVPPQWEIPVQAGGERIVHAGDGAVLDAEMLREAAQCPWLILSNGRFTTQINLPLLNRALSETGADIVAVRASPELRARQEHVRLTHQGELVGCRRLYRDVAQPAPVPSDWPHHLFLRTRCVEELLGSAPARSFEAILGKSRALGLKIRSFAIAGTAIDLESPRGLLALSRWMLNATPQPESVSSLLCHELTRRGGLQDAVSPDARLVGPILMGQGVRIEAGAVVVGPTVLCECSTIGSESMVDAAIVGRRVVVERGSRLTGSCHLTARDRQQAHDPIAVASGRCASSACPGSEFRMWPKLSYARCFKRMADVVAAVIVLVLFAPIIPFVALAIRISSPGPVFYKDWRQGLHGRPFHCIKFRTMRVGAAEIQDKLRFVSEVDGPQFKMNDDPRISSVGRFLRETSIDEIPQFFNVLVGQMSVVGPRPSPESENTQCPSWRDARLSVRPGITGLWQVCRTRQPFMDFQEWIYYDTKYVSELSLRNDLRICVKTFTRLLSAFVDQF
jgi:lipopolysaccharide/colanic/teichoic acid biosynthesis glycosyltransferase